MLGWLSRLFSSSVQAPNTAQADPAAASIVTPLLAQTVIPASAVSRLQEEDINANFNGWLFEQTDYSGMFINPTEQAILDELERLVRSKQAGAGLVRRMPGVIPQLLQSLRSENFSGAELSRKISNDIVLVAEVIRLANSALSSSSETITSIQHAILVLGQGGLRQLITGVAFRPIIDIRSGRATSLAAPRIWYQSELCALACHQLARDEGLNVFEAFLAGLIQNVGLIVSLRIVDQIAGVDQAVGSASFCNALVSYARTLSCSIGREWNFPEDVIRAVEEQASTAGKAVLSPMGRALKIADYLSKARVLSLNDRLEITPQYTRGLSDSALRCMAMLSSRPIDESVASPASNVGMSRA